MKTNNIEKRAFTTSEAARYIGLSESFLRQARMNGPCARRLDAPVHTPLGCRKIVYLIEDLNQWLDKHKANNPERISSAQHNEVAL